MKRSIEEACKYYRQIILKTIINCLTHHLIKSRNELTSANDVHAICFAVILIILFNQ